MRRLLSLIAVMVIAAPLASAADPAALQALLAERSAAQASAAADAGEVDASGIERIDHFAFGNPQGTGTNPFFASGTDLAFDGDLVYAMQQNAGGNPMEGGIHIYDTSGLDELDEDGVPGIIEQVGYVDCPANQNDVAVVEPGIVAIGYHSANGACFDEPGSGVRLFDVSDLETPKQIGLMHGLPGGTHTLTVHPDGDFIFASPGGLPGNGGAGGRMQIIDISDRTAPKVANAFISNGIGCHDFAFMTRSSDSLPSAFGDDLGICVGFGETQIWDLTSPANPVVISRIANPLITFNHTGITTDDGKYLVIGDEAFGAHDCAGGPTGALFMYDVSTPENPIPQSYFGLDRAKGDAPVSTDRTNWCTAHIYNFIPGTMIMIVSWYSGGINVIDWSDPLAPREIGHFRTDGVYADGEVTNYWSAYFHEGRIYANDRVRGFDALEFTGDLAPLGDPDADINAVVKTIPSTSSDRWRAGLLFDTPTAEQALHLASRPAPDLASPSLVCVLR